MREFFLAGFEDLIPPSPGGAYVSVNVRNETAFVAIQFPIKGDQFLYQGRLGEDLSTEEGYLAAQLCAANVMAQLKKYVGLEKVMGLNHLDVYYQQASGWDDAPLVADGASQLFLKVLGEKGQHSRALIGAQSLPRNFCVGVVSSFALKRS